jgi:hypothetical protein
MTLNLNNITCKSAVQYSVLERGRNTSSKTITKGAVVHTKLNIILIRNCYVPLQTLNVEGENGGRNNESKQHMQG